MVGRSGEHVVKVGARTYTFGSSSSRWRFRGTNFSFSNITGHCGGEMSNKARIKKGKQESRKLKEAHCAET
jgi:hypothetical protein